MKTHLGFLESDQNFTKFQRFIIDKILLCICDGMNIAFNGFYNFVFSIVSSLSDFDYYKYVTL